MPLTAEQRERISLSDPWDFGWLAEMVEAWGFRMMQERGHFADRYEVAKRWFEQEYAPVSDMLAEGGLTEPEETEAEAYMRLAGQRYLLLRTHEWSDEIVNRLRRRQRQEAPAAPAPAAPTALLTRAPWVAELVCELSSPSRLARPPVPPPRASSPRQRAQGRRPRPSSAASAAVHQAHHTANTMKGVAHAVTPHRHEEMDDVTLADRVRSRDLPRRRDAPKGSVSVDVQAGVAYLRGEVADEEWIERSRQGRAQGRRASTASRTCCTRRARRRPRPSRAPSRRSSSAIASTSRAPGWPSPGHGREHDQQARVA